MKAENLDIHTSKAVVTYYETSIVYTLADDEKTLFWDFYKEFLAIQVTVGKEWTDSQSVPNPEIWIKGVSILKDGSRGKKFVNQFYHAGHFKNDPAFRHLISKLTEQYYKAAEKQVMALDSLGHLRPEYVGAN